MEAIMDTMSRRPSTPTEPPVERLAQDMAAVVHDEVAKVRADVGGILRRGGTGALLLGAAGVCGILALGSAATTILRTADAVLPDASRQRPLPQVISPPVPYWPGRAG
ncbi:phage holin family protein [Luedemannella flava]